VDAAASGFLYSQGSPQPGEELYTNRKTKDEHKNLLMNSLHLMGA
jgi:hypothetical protein